MGNNAASRLRHHLCAGCREGNTPWPARGFPDKVNGAGEKARYRKTNTKNQTTMKTTSHQPEDEAMESKDSELYALFLVELADILNAEQQLIKALPRMASAAASEELKVAFESHLTETEQHVTRLEEIFVCLDEPVKSKECKAMKGLLEEGRNLLEEMKDSSALDAALIAAAQKIEHYEIASYGTVCAWANKLGYDEPAELLNATLDEEKAADETLTEIAETVNDNAD